jgi:DNA-binding MarR family transcriptional regulator
MPSELETLLHLTKPIRSVSEEAFVSLIRTADMAAAAEEALFREAGVTMTQYNVLRILRGSPSGLPCNEIGRRLISRVPDVTRLLDRMETNGLVARKRDTTDRRVVFAYITPRGLDVVGQLDGPVGEFDRRTLGSLGEEKLRLLCHLLEEVRRTLPEETTAC